MKRACFHGGAAVRDLSALLEAEKTLLDDDLVMTMVTELTAVQKLFLAGLGRGLSPREAALLAGSSDEDADRIAEAYMASHPVIAPLAAHILALRELATMDGEEPVFPGSKSIQ